MSDDVCSFVGTRSVNDIVVSVDFENGGTFGSVSLRRWNGTTYLPISSGAAGCNVADTICAFSNTSPIPTGPWTSYDEHGDIVTTLETNAFTEFGLNLTQLLGGNVPCVASAIVKTRSSPSFSSTLMDFASGAFRTCPVKSGTKFHDLDADGVRDAGEPGLPGWTIRAYRDTNANGVLDADRGRDADGLRRDRRERQLHDDVPARALRGLRGPPGRLDPVLPDAGARSAVRARALLRAAGRSTCPWSRRTPGNDFGNYQVATKTGVKFEDQDADGVKDAGEPGLTGWTINAYLDANGDGIRNVGENTLSATTTTGAGGAYTLSLVPGKYIVCEVQQGGWVQSVPGATPACGAGRRAAGGSR